MTRSDLIERMASAQHQLDERDVELAVKTMLQQMSDALASGERIEIRGFGSFSLNYRSPRIGRNPKTGQPVAVPARHVPPASNRGRNCGIGLTRLWLPNRSIAL